MACHSMGFVPPLGVVSQQPLHDFRQGTAFVRANDEVDMVAHDAKVVDSEEYFFFSRLRYARNRIRMADSKKMNWLRLILAVTW